MAALPNFAGDPTLNAVDQALEAAQDRRPRDYLGMSAIGDPCARKLWYGWRWCTAPKFGAAALKRFEDGHQGEALQAARLRLVPGIELRTHDENGEQLGFTLLGGHFRGHVDGLIKGLLQAPKTWHVWEHKQVDSAKQSKLEKLKDEVGEKAALEQWDEVYYAQAVIYMSAAGLDRHYLTCSSPGGRRQVSCRTNASPARAKALIEKARAIVEAPEPPPRLSEKPEHYLCKWCDHRHVCHEGALPEVNCRSCCHSTPALDGDSRWVCEKYQMDIPREYAEHGCRSHVYIPALTPWERVDANAVENWIEYRLPTGEIVRNGSRETGAHESTELHAAQQAGDVRVLLDGVVQAVREQLGGVVEPTS